MFALDIMCINLALCQQNGTYVLFYKQQINQANHDPILGILQNKMLPWHTNMAYAG